MSAFGGDIALLRADFVGERANETYPQISGKKKKNKKYHGTKRRTKRFFFLVFIFLNFFMTNSQKRKYSNGIICFSDNTTTRSVR
jgi:hypothetical protein